MLPYRDCKRPSCPQTWTKAVGWWFSDLPLDSFHSSQASVSFCSFTRIHHQAHVNSQPHCSLWCHLVSHHCVLHLFLHASGNRSRASNDFSLNQSLFIVTARPEPTPPGFITSSSTHQSKFNYLECSFYTVKFMAHLQFQPHCAFIPRWGLVIPKELLDNTCEARHMPSPCCKCA